MMDWNALLEAAVAAQARAYAPYSRYHVGAALVSGSGQVFTGCNVENISFGGTICAERTAIVTMVAAGERQIGQLLVVTADGGSPCGMCLQVIAEFAGPNLEVALATPAGVGRILTLSALLPHAFKTDTLG